MSFAARLAGDARLIGAAVEAALSELRPGPVADAMAHAMKGGKRLRGFLVIESARVFGLPEAVAALPAAAVEALHAYSLVHDDLPAMDDDDLRRGQPTVHVKWDEATAILVGDALQSLAFELLASAELAPEQRVALIRGLAEAAGANGMVLGQAQDIAAETSGRALGLGEITELQANKTGALIGWSAMAGPVMAGADPAPMRAYAAALGLAFQIADDLLDVAGDEAKAGKRVKKDAGRGKATFVSLLGEAGARARAAALVDEAVAALDIYGAEADGLRQAARFVIERES